MTTLAHAPNEEPPLTRAAQLADKAGRLLLILCTSPIALFPVALAVRAYGYLFP